ncbi:Peptidase A1 domain-containing protein [Aphelenchoides bicaudatus]|nr:Peptidase A1 domain-containing protein [Aphelenchoides bicaudatus]
MFTRYFIFTALVLVFMAQTSSSIKCYVCVGNNDSDCNKSEKSVDCPKGVKGCGKTLFGGKVIKSCANETDTITGKCDDVVFATYCTCNNKDNCNSAITYTSLGFGGLLSMALFDSPWMDFFVGVPPTYYILNVETGFRNVWLVDPTYENIPDGQQVYDPNNSTTSKLQSQEQFGTSGIYNLYGPSYEDVFLSDTNFWNQSFGTVQTGFTSQGPAAPQIPFDGIIGLAWDPNGKKTPDDDSPAIIHLLKDKQLKVVSMWQERDAIKDFGVYHSSLISFGRIETDLCSAEITYVPLNFDYYNTLLSFNVDAFRFDRYETRASKLGKVDTGLASIFLPDGPYTTIYRIIDPDYDWDQHVLTTDCSNALKFKDWVFTIGGREFSLSASDYLVDFLRKDNKCVLAMELSTDYYTPYALGNPFLRRYCQFLDVTNNKLGLADAIHESPQTTL